MANAHGSSRNTQFYDKRNTLLKQNHEHDTNFLSPPPILVLLDSCLWVLHCPHLYTTLQMRTRALSSDAPSRMHLARSALK